MSPPSGPSRVDRSLRNRARISNFQGRNYNVAKVHHNPVSVSARSSFTVLDMSSTGPVVGPIRRKAVDIASPRSEFSSLRQLDSTIDSVLRDKMSKSRATYRLTKGSIRTIWMNTTLAIERTLLSGKACLVPGLGIFSFYYDVRDTGSTGKKIHRRCVFHLAESFTKGFGIHTSSNIPSSGGIPIETIPICEIAKAGNVNRDAAQESIRDIIRTVGENIQLSCPVSV